MRELLKSFVRFSWSMSLFGAKSLGQIVSVQDPNGLNAVSNAIDQQLGGLRRVSEIGHRVQRSVVDTVFGSIPGGPAAHDQPPTAADDSSGPGLFDQGKSIDVEFENTTQGPFWPPAEVADSDGNFVVVNGALLQEVEPGKIVPVPTRGAIVSKETVPPLKEGKEDFSNQFGAPYRVIRDLDLGPHGADWDLELYSLSCGPFVGEFGGGQPRMPAGGESRFNLNSSPRWTRDVAPPGADASTFRRQSYPMGQVPITHLHEISPTLSIGVPSDPGKPLAAGQPADARHRQPITLRDYLRGRATLTITPVSPGRVAGTFTRARFDIVLDDVLPHSVYTFFVLHAATFMPPPKFQMPAPLALPNLVVSDGRGRAEASYVLDNPFPDPAEDAHGNRILKIVAIFNSGAQNWGASMTDLGTGSNGHTMLGADLQSLSSLTTRAS